MHHNRHKEILKIVRQIVAIDEPNAVFPPAKASNSRGRRSSSATNSNNLTDTGSECPSVEDTRMTRRERKKAKKSGNGTRDRKSFEAFPLDETDYISEAIHLTVHESKGAWEGTYVYDHGNTAVEENAVIEENDAEYDAESMTAHFESFAVKPPVTHLKDLTPRQRKIVKRTSTPVKYASHGLGSRKYSTQFTANNADPYDGVDPDIFFRLGIEVVSPPKNSKIRKDLVAKLIVAVKEDIEIITREDKETDMRAEGFWRWAGRTAYNTILETRENLDWATGQKRGIRLPQFVDFDDEDIEESAQAPSEKVEKEIPKPQMDKSTSKPVVKAKTVDEDGFTIASSKKSLTKKPQGNSKKFTKLPLNYKLTSPSLDIDEEEGEDVVEMLRRYEQKKLGERNLGGTYDGSTPDRRTGRGKARTLIVK